MRLPRRGFTLLEVCVAAMLLAALTTTVAEGLHGTAVQRRAAERREIALFEATNTLERLTAADANALTLQPATAGPLSPTAATMLPSGRLTTEITAAADDSAARRITVEVHWLDASGQAESPVRMSAWVYRQRDKK